MTRISMHYIAKKIIFNAYSVLIVQRSAVMNNIGIIVPKVLCGPMLRLGNVRFSYHIRIGDNHCKVNDTILLIGV